MTKHWRRWRVILWIGAATAIADEIRAYLQGEKTLA